MEDELPPHVRDYRIETRSPKKRVVEHIYDDGNPLPECWKSEKRPLGSGGQGTVYLQTCTSGSRRYTQRAVKVISLRERSVRRHHLRELQIVVRFSHDRYSRYFVKSLGWYLLGTNTLCITMEYLAKGDLEMYLGSKPPLLEIECRQIIAQVTKGLALMHKEGYAHRDIKPQNVLIQQHPMDCGLPTWWVKLTDFGISKPLETRATSAASTIFGTLLYMAPERLGRGKGTDISYPAADIWALGVLSYRLLTGVVLFPTIADIFEYCGDPELGVLDNRRISTDGAAFVLALLKPQASLRLEAAAALVHDWIRPYTTLSAQAAVVLDFHSQSSSESSRNSSFDEERGMTTIISDATDLKSHLPARLDPDAPPTMSPIAADASGDEGQSHAASSEGNSPTIRPLLNNNPATWQLEQTLQGHNDLVTSVAFSPDLKLLASCSLDKTVRLWNTTAWQLQQTHHGHKNGFRSLAFSPDSKLLAVSSYETIRLWNTTPWRLQQTLPGRGGWAGSLSFSPDSKLLALCSYNKTVHVRSTTTWQFQKTLQFYKSLIAAILFPPSPDSKLLALYSERTVQLWNTTTWHLQQTLQVRDNWASAIAFSPDSKVLALASVNRTLRVWNTTTWKLRRLLHYDDGISSVAFSPDSKLLASSSHNNKTIQLWNTTTWQLQQTLRGHTNGVRSVAFSPDSKLLASGSLDNTIRLWGIATNILRSQ